MNRWSAGILASAMIGAILFSTPPLPAAPPPTTPEEQADLQTNKAAITESDFQRQLDQFEYSSRIEANPDIPVGQRLLVDYGGYVSYNYLSDDDPSQNTHILSDTTATAYALLNLDNAQEFFVRGQMDYRDYGIGDDFGGGIEGPGQHSAVQQAYYRFDLQRYLSAYRGVALQEDAAVELGRQTVVWANGLTLDQNIDGGVFDFTRGALKIEDVAGITVPETIDFDTSRPGFNDRTKRGFFGAILSMQIDRHQPFIYILSERDFNENEKLITLSGASAITTHFNYNGLYIGAGSTGSLTDHLIYGAEATMEGGNDLSNSYVVNHGAVVPVDQRHDDIAAFAADGRLNYLFADPHNSRASLEVIMASGDHDRVSTNDTFGGPKVGTTDQAFNGFGLLNTGLAFSPDISNVVITRLGFSTQPLNNVALFRKLEIGTDVFLYDKYLERAPIDEQSHSGRFLGFEPDVYANWQITSDLTFVMRYGCFFPGNDVGADVIGSNRTRQLFFTGVTLAF
jgi:hypothetical protein